MRKLQREITGVSMNRYWEREERRGLESSRTGRRSLYQKLSPMRDSGLLELLVALIVHVDDLLSRHVDRLTCPDLVTPKLGDVESPTIQTLGDMSSSVEPM
jgi:hypothetical protein